MSNTKTALQVTDFDFYGDSLVALKDNSTGEVYTAINSVLRGLGFKDEQVRYQRSKWINDISISKGVLKFNIPTNKGNQNSECINSRKLPIALAKINITKRMIRDYPNITHRLELYQDKCADVLASVFIDKQNISNIDMKPITDSLNKIVALLENQESRISKLEEYQHQQTSLPEPTYRKPYNPWFRKMSPKYTLLEEHFHINRGSLYRNILNELENLYDMDTQQIQADYLYENNLTSCYPLEPYEYSPKYRDMIEQIVNSNLIKYGIASEDDPITSKKHITIFDTPIEEICTK
ncbi:hypothetical protein DS742_14125 [Lacrimispora amygdalina]|uniref:Antirepressor protein ant N-terminal domain-containing protein n=1 Tax=Lacrimispora amygdalina TaxID=253257 RepID=A0A3E2NB83_9FIRM|nr:phage antirepressor N-terminal domain-containing protein [Clostridium indicum]RFZ78246.1 hypothetical protein DS742_14125 [Clostridium indicum]